MPYVDYDAARAEFARTASDPFTFRLGGEDFTILQEPMFGDVVELYEAPPPEVNESAAAFALVRFIKRMLHPDDRARFEKIFYFIPTTEAVPIVIKLGGEIAQHFTAPFLQPPSESSPPRRRSGGAKRRTNGAGRKAS